MTRINKLTNKLVLLICGLLLGSSSFAQEQATKVVTKTTHTTSTDWYATPWVWIAGVAVFILLLVAIVRGNSRSDA